MQMIHFPPSRAAGLDRLARFTPRMGRIYTAGRNSDPGLGKRRAVSELSPYVRHRLVTETELLTAAVQAHGLDGAEKFVQEVFWRTYWKGWLEMRPGIYDRYRDGLPAASAALKTDRVLARRLGQAMAGRTGIDGFDAWVEELTHTGYLHNHARMWFASIWIFTLNLPWELGADFFFRHLLDADAASNTLSWRWVAGLQTTGKTYLARRDNIREHSFGRFDPAGLAPVAVPLTELAPPSPVRLSTLPTADQRAATGLLLHGDDVAGVGWDAGVEIQALAGLIIDDGRSTACQNWTCAVLGDGVSMAGRALGLTGRCVTVAEVLGWARGAGLSQIVTPEAPAGPVREALAMLSTQLAQTGVQLVPVRHSFDAMCWPAATKGFFAFKEHIAGWVEQLPLV